MPTDWLSCAGSGEPSTSAGTEGNNGANTNNNANANTNENNTTTETTQTPSQGSQPQQSASMDWTSTIVIFGIMIVFVLIMIIPNERKSHGIVYVIIPVIVLVRKIWPLLIGSCIRNSPHFDVLLSRYCITATKLTGIIRTIINIL